MSELKPCPFCGGEAELRHNKTWDYEVRCKKCRAKTRQHHENEVGAIDDWNIRTFSDYEFELKMDELLCYLTNGKFSKSRQYSLEFMKSCVDEEYEYAYAEEIATLGCGECEIVASSTDGLGSDSPKYWFELSCGHSFTVDGLELPVACAVCGKAVKR